MTSEPAHHKPAAEPAAPLPSNAGDGARNRSNRREINVSQSSWDPIQNQTISSPATSKPLGVERLGESGRMLGERLVGEGVERRLRPRERRRPEPLVCQLRQEPRRHLLLLGKGQLRDLGKSLLEKGNHDNGLHLQLAASDSIERRSLTASRYQTSRSIPSTCSKSESRVTRVSPC